MKKIIDPAIFIFLILILPGCRKSYISSGEQEILFQMDYINYAWGYHHYGIMIDASGRIYKYENPENWNFPDENYILTGKQVAENLSMCTLAEQKIPEDELKKYSSNIDNIASSKVTAIRQTGADAGTLQFICYRFSENSDMYIGYVIKTEGDFTAENLNFYSKRVVAWLKDISTKTTINHE